ncbi:MAG: DUF2232 domain-containing protein [Longimicrobiales bacterium]
MAATMSPLQPLLLIVVPLGFLMVGLEPRRPWLVAVGVLLALAPLIGGPTGPLWYIERGWVYALGGSFLAAAVAVPAAGFLLRGLLGVGAASVLAGAILVLTPDGWARTDGVIGSRVRASASQMAVAWSEAGADRFLGDVADAARRAAELQALLYPGMIGLASLAALAIGWWAWSRVVANRPRPLAPLREFRFPDDLVWLFVVALALVLLPLGQEATRAGSNLALFMGGLYALRGLAVALSVATPAGPWLAVLAGLAAVLLYPLALSVALALGLSDTWVDYRTRRRGAASRS